MSAGTPPYKTLEDSQPAADGALVEWLQKMRESMILGLGPGRPFAADSSVIIVSFGSPRYQRAAVPIYSSRSGHE